jgi:aspartate 1-decarboxylase
MYRSMLKSKIHRLTVTDSNLEYEGSISIDEALLDLADILPYEQVHVYNVSNGNRFETYAIKARPNSGIICVNGAAAHLAKKGDIVIIVSYRMLPDEVSSNTNPILVYVDNGNIASRVNGINKSAVGSIVK